MSEERGPLLILGAGASRPYGFPTSGQLRSIILGDNDGTRALQDLGASWPKISKFLAGTKTLTENPAIAGAVVDQFRAPDIPLHLPIARLLLNAVFETYGVPRELADDFRDEFFRSQRVSIDAFAARWHEYEWAAKLSIAAVLLFCERGTQLNGNWYQQLLEAILRNEDAFKSSGLDVITFNYDRSFELYLHRALASHCRNDPRELAAFKKQIRITHVYGTTGELWPAAGMEHAIGYGDISKIWRSSWLSRPCSWK